MFSKRFIPLYLFAFTLVIYISNLSRSVYGGDVGDLVTAAYTGGIAHPPGYPLFTVLGWLLTRLTPFINMPPAFLVGLISAISSALGVALYYQLTLMLIKDRFIALISSLILAFTYLFWFYAEIAEVFALNNLFAVILLFCAALYRQTGYKKYFYLFALFAGLAIFHHQTIVLIFPSLLIIIFSQLWRLIRKDRRTVGIGFALGLVGLIPYLYPVIASLSHPPIDWLNMKNNWDFQSLIDFILRKRYGTFQAGTFFNPTFSERVLILKNYLVTIGTQLTPPVIFLVIVGLMYSLKRNFVFSLAILLAYVLTGPFFVTYAGFPLESVFRFGITERFMSLSAVILMIFFPFGLYYFLSLLGKVVRKEFLTLITCVFFILPLTLFILNFPKTDLSDVWIGDEFGRDYMQTLPKNSLVFLSGDTNLFNTWYMHYALHVRPDLTVLNSLDPIQSNKTLALRFQHMRHADSYQDSIIAMKENIWDLARNHTIVSDIEMVGHKVTFLWVPYGLTSRLVIDKSELPTLEDFRHDSSFLWRQLHVPLSNKATLAEGNLTIADIPSNYANGLLRAGNYFVDKYNDSKTAEDYYRESLAVQPDYENAYFALGTMYWSKQNNCDLGIKTISKAIDLNPTQARFYQVLYIALKSCKASEKQQKSLRDAYKTRFNTDLLNDIKDDKS